MDQQTGITAQTSLLGIIGHPVSHSLSPLFQNAALNALNLDYVYLAFDILPEELSNAVQSIRTLKFRGVNVTVPHKETIVKYLDKLVDLGLILGAVNTVVVEGGNLVGYNTDGFGFSQALEQNHLEVNGKNAILVGAGGVARAVLYILIQKGIQKVFLYNRSPQRSSLFQYWAETTLKWVVEVDSWENFINGRSPYLRCADLLIHTTSLGLHQEILPTPWNEIENCGAVIDVVYHKDETPLVKEARKRSKIAFDGKMMLLYQGAESFRLFTGFNAPIEIMERALNEAKGLDGPLR